MKPYSKQNVTAAQRLRREMTPWERRLWYTFLRSYPIRFYRQKPLGAYIADFYCAKAKLVIELDGGGHYEKEQQEKDRLRTETLEKIGLTVLRFSNADIDYNFRGVCEAIDQYVKSQVK